MILYTAIVEHITTYLTTPFYLLFSRFYLSLSLHTLLHRTVIELRFQQLHSLCTVLRLIARFGILDQDFLLLACIRILILITQAYTRLYFIHVLPTSTTRSERIPTHTSRINIYLYRVVYKWSNKDRSKASHSLTLGIKRTHTHQTVHAIFTLQVSKRILSPLELHCNALYSSLITHLNIRDRYLIAMSFAPTHIHTHKHISPILTFCTTCTRINFHHTLHRIFCLTEHIL